MESDDFACDMCMEDLSYNICSRMSPDEMVATMTEIIPLDEFLDRVIERGIDPVGECCLCEGNYIWGGNNPYPVVDDDESRCCTRCDVEVVTPTRIRSRKFHRYA